MAICGAISKYGINNFSFLVIDIFTEVTNKENNKKLLDMEDYYLKSLLPNYNILTEAGNSFGYKHTELSRIKMKRNFSVKRREFIGNLNRGKNLTKEINGNKNKLILLREVRKINRNLQWVKETFYILIQ